MSENTGRNKNIQIQIVVAKENLLISCAVTAQLVCVIVFAYIISYEA